MLQGLSLDLGGLAACLADQPLHKVLRLAGPPDSDAGGLPDDRHNGAAAAVDILQGPVLHAATQQPVIAQHKASDVSSAPATRIDPAAESKAPLPPSEIGTQSAAESPADEELDFLLGLTTGAAPSGGPGPAALPAAAAPQQGEEQSLEDWLDNL
jgi:hypothetical protein